MAREAFHVDPDEAWHPIARLLWDGALESGQADFYQSSDVAMLYSICDDVSYYKTRKVRSGQMLASLYSAMSSLLITEGDRRRVRIELEEPAEDGPDLAVVAQLDDYRAALGA